LKEFANRHIIQLFYNFAKIPGIRRGRRGFGGGEDADADALSKKIGKGDSDTKKTKEAPA
jgi:hypothetical protein